MIRDKIVEMERQMAERMLNYIRIDIEAYEARNGHKPAKIFVSKPLLLLLRAYNRHLIVDWMEGQPSRLYGIIVQPYSVDAYDVLEYYLATGGGMTTLPRED